MGGEKGGDVCASGSGYHPMSGPHISSPLPTNGASEPNSVHPFLQRESNASADP